MKICMITSYPPAKDGVGDVSVHLVRGINDVDKNSEVYIITHKRKDAKEDPKIFRTITQKVVSGRSYLTQVPKELSGISKSSKEVNETLEVIEKIKPDVVHTQYEPGLYNLFYLPILFRKLKSRGYKIILTLHGRDYFPLTVFHKKFLYGLPNKIIVHTKSHEKNLKSRGIKNILTIPMGLNEIRTRNKRFRKFVRSVFFFGYLSPHKGVSYLVRAFQKVLEKSPDAKLIIYGPTNPIHDAEKTYKKELLKLIDELGIQKNVEFSEQYTPREKIPMIKSQIAVFPYAKTYSAGQSEALLDSISSGKAVIVSHVPGLYESVEDGKNGFVVESENVEQLSEAIKKLFSNPKLVARMEKENLRMVEKLDWKNIARETLNLYKKLV